MGLAGYYIQFISNFSKVSKTFTKLLQRAETFIFDSDSTITFNELKQALISTPILIFPKSMSHLYSLQMPVLYRLVASSPRDLYKAIQALNVIV